MVNEPSTPKTGEGFWLWGLKILTGALVLVVLFIHLTVNHFLAPKGLLSYAEVVAYLSNPVITAMETFFLIVVVSHALLGLRSLLLDLKPSPSLIRAMNGIFLAVGVVSIAYGIWLIRVIITNG